MFNWLRKLLGPSKQEVSEIQALLQQYSTTVLAQKQALQEKEDALRQAEEEREALRLQVQEREAKRNSTEPWVEIRSAEFNELKGVHIELDWNDAFIQYLKESGIKGRDDETIVQKWLALLYQDLTVKLEHVSVDNTDKLVIRDLDVNNM